MAALLQDSPVIAPRAPVVRQIINTLDLQMACVNLVATTAISETNMSRVRARLGVTMYTEIAYVPHARRTTAYLLMLATFRWLAIPSASLR